MMFRHLFLILLKLWYINYSENTPLPAHEVVGEGRSVSVCSLLALDQLHVRFRRRSLAQCRNYPFRSCASNVGASLYGYKYVAEQ